MTVAQAVVDQGEQHPGRGDLVDVAPGALPGPATAVGDPGPPGRAVRSGLRNGSGRPQSTWWCARAILSEVVVVCLWVPNQGQASIATFDRAAGSLGHFSGLIASGPL